MADMKVMAIKLTLDESSTKVLYEKDGRLYIRSGNDGFTEGTLAKAPISSYCDTWGFRKVNNPPIFSSSQELRGNIVGFQVGREGTVDYQ